MDHEAVERARQRIAEAVAGRTGPGDLDAALERARAQVETLAQATAELESSLPDRVGEAVREGVRAEALPVARQLAEVRGLMNAVIRRLERLEGDVLAERHARVDDLSLLVELITSGWKGVDTRLAGLDATLQAGAGGVVYRMDERRGGTADTA